MRRALSLLTWALLGTFALGPSPASAAPRPTTSPAASSGSSEAQSAAEALALQAKDKFRAKKFEEAAKLFMQAYAKDPQPPLVFNAARAYQEAGMNGEAAGLFRLYLTIAKDDAGIAKAKEHLAALKDAGGDAAPADAKPGDAKPGDGASSDKPQVHGSSAPTAGVAKDGPAAWPRWVVTAAGVACAATGVALVVLGSNESKDAAGMKIATDADIKAYNSKFDSAERTWTAGVALSAVGVGLGAWATWMHLSAPAERTAWQVGVGPRSVALALRF